MLQCYILEYFYFATCIYEGVYFYSILGLKSLSLSALNELLEELEVTIKDYSETLISELALRDELEYEKEMKNQFISMLLLVQKKRKDTQMSKRTGSSPASHKRQRSTGTEAGTVSFHTEELS